MDALAVHNYGGNHEPERDPGDCGICFRRAEIYRQVMVEQGDAATPIWATEFGWLLDPGRNMGQYDWMRVSAEKQAEYVVRSFRYARGNWPWMTGLLLSNLDASTSPYHTGAAERDALVRDPEQGPLATPGLEGVQGLARGGRRAGRPAVTPRHERPAGTPCRVFRQPARLPRPLQRRVKLRRLCPPAPDVAASAAAPSPSPTPEPNTSATAETATPTPATRRPPPPRRPRPGRRPDPAQGRQDRRHRRQPARAAQHRGPGVAILMDGTTVEVVGEDVRAEGITWRNVRTDRQHDRRRDRLGGRAVPGAVVSALLLVI